MRVFIILTASFFSSGVMSEGANFSENMNRLMERREEVKANNVASDKRSGVVNKDKKKFELPGMNPDRERRILIEHLPQFRRCYLQRDRSLKYEHNLQFTVNYRGHVKSADIEYVSGSDMDSKIYDCLRNVLLGIRFPASRNSESHEIELKF